MAIKLSSYYSLRNNCIVRSLEDPFSARYWFGNEFTSRDKKSLRMLVDSLDKLKEGSSFQKGKPFVGEHVAITNVTELRDVTSDPKLAAEYLDGVLKIFKKYRVIMHMYEQLKDCFNEMGLNPNPELTEIIKHMGTEFISNERRCLNGICWNDIKRYAKLERAVF